MNDHEHTLLTTLADNAKPVGDWWKGDAPTYSDIALPSRVVNALAQDGLHTVEDIKAAGPKRLSRIPGIGKHAMKQIVAMLRALDNGAA